MSEFRKDSFYPKRKRIDREIVDMARWKRFPTGRGWERNPDSSGNTVKDYLGERNANDIVRHCEQKEHPVVVEIGLGQANALGELNEKCPNIFPIGIDLYIQEEAKEKMKDGKLCLVQGQAEQIFLADQSVDVLYVALVYRYFIDKLEFISEVIRVLKEDGVAYIEIGTDGRIYTTPSLQEIILGSGLSGVLVIDKFKISFPAQYWTDVNEVEVDQTVLKIEKSKMPEIVDWKVEFQGCNYKGTYAESFYELK